MRGDLDGLIRPDGSVIIPADVAHDVLRALIRDLTARVQRDGGEVSPQVRRVLVALHTASQRNEGMTDVGTPVSVLPNIEVSVAEAARRMECSDRYVRRLLATGRLSGRRVSARMWLVDEMSLEHFRRGNHGQEESRRAG